VEAAKVRAKSLAADAFAYSMTYFSKREITCDEGGELEMLLDLYILLLFL
jgi:hypothetical protein